MVDNSQQALLALADGTLWPGMALGAIGRRTGELVFNTSMAGYQEILTDPSYQGQIVVMTAPHIGNYGVTSDDDESAHSWVAGFVVRAASPIASNWRASGTLEDFLAERGIVSMTGVDTRTLVRHIRIYGAMNAAMSSTPIVPEELIACARSAPDMNGLDLVRDVTCRAPYEVAPDQDVTLPVRRVVAYDFGIKRNILREMTRRGCVVTVVPAMTSAEDVLAMRPDGVFLSNGPGDPAAVTYAIENLRRLLGRVPIFGICLGHQLLALALGGQTYKLKFGHRGGNQPVKQLASGAVAISSHNHGFAVRAASLPAVAQVTHVDLNDGCVEGLAAPGLRAFSVQYHPEAAPGPHDSLTLFDEFVDLLRRNTNITK
jgi:carbamoyl-phosphate synthase small subunit